MRFRELLQSEFERRRGANRRYSLRSFARDLQVDHATLGQILRGRRPIPLASLRSFGRRLGLPAEEIAAYHAAEQLPDADTAYRQEQLRHWTAEARAILAEPHHQALLRLTRGPEFRADVRAIAATLGVTPDEVNIAAARLARLGFLEMQGERAWRDVHRLGEASAAEFRKRALARVRELAPMFPKRFSTKESK